MKTGMRFGALSLAALVGSVNAGCMNFRPPPEPVPARYAGTPPAQVWTAKVGRGLVGPVAQTDGVLYLAGFDRKVRAVTLDHGRVLWERRLDGRPVGGTQLVGGMLYVATAAPNGRLYAIRPDSGKIRWQKKSGEIHEPIAVIDSLIIAHTNEGMVVAADTAAGTERWHRRIPAGRAAPMPDGAGHVVVTSMDSMYRVRLSDGFVVARAATPGSLLAGWTALDGLLVAGTTDSIVVGVDPAALAIRWRVKLDAPVETAPARAGDTLYVATRVGTLYRLVLGAGTPTLDTIARLRWPLTSSPVLVGGALVVGGADGTLRALRPDGGEIWRIAIWRPIDVPPIPLPDGLVAIGGDGDLHRYRP